MEQLADMNPDYLFVQFSTDENADAPNALEDFKRIQSSKILLHLK